MEASKCLGCSICKPTCDSEAVQLVVRENVSQPPKAMEFLEVRIK